MASKITKVRNNMSKLSLTDTCRICMRKNISMKALFGSDCKIVERIQFCTGILFTENTYSPSYICTECVSQLNIAHNFKTACIESEKTFRQIDVKVEVKTEKLGDLTVKEEIEYTYEDEAENEEIRETELLKDEGLNTTINTAEQDQAILEPTRNIAKQDEAIPNATKNTIKLKVVCKRSEKRKVIPKNIQGAVSFRKLYCGKCNIRFETKEESIQHHEGCHNVSKYICEVCGKQFVYQASHYAHMRIHAGPSYACAHCAYVTVNKSDLKTHLTLHTGEKNFHCHACPGTFRTSSNLQNHIRHKHGGEKRFLCDRCDKSFFSGDRLRRHLDAHNNVKRHECPVCHSCFSRRCHWKKHLLKQHAVRTPPMRPGRRGTRQLDPNVHVNIDK